MDTLPSFITSCCLAYESHLRVGWPCCLGQHRTPARSAKVLLCAHHKKKKIHPLNHRKNSSKISAWTKNSMICVLPDGKEGVERVMGVDIPGFSILPVASFTIPESEGFVQLIWVPSG